MIKRPEILAVVIGRNRKVYARVYKMTSYIEAFAKHYFETEKCKSREEGFVPTDMIVEKPNNTTIIYRVMYSEV